jgi:hypothetical protein
VPDEGLEAASVAGRGDDRVGLHPGAVGQVGAGAVERLDGGRDLDPPVLDRVDHLAVDDGGCLAVAPQPGEDALVGPGESVLGQVAKSQPADQPDLGVGDRWREAEHRERGQVAGQPGRRP